MQVSFDKLSVQKVADMYKRQSIQCMSIGKVGLPPKMRVERVAGTYLSLGDMNSFFSYVNKEFGYAGHCIFVPNLGTQLLPPTRIFDGSPTLPILAWHVKQRVITNS